MSVDPFPSSNIYPLGEVLFNSPNDLDNPQFLKSVYDAIASPVFVVDVLADGNFRYVAFNPTHAAWTGLCATLLRGKTPEQIFSAVDAAIVRQQYAHCVQYGKTISYEECSPFQSASTWWITTLTPLKNHHGQVYRLIGTSTNITERKQAEESLQLQADREQLLGAIAIRQARLYERSQTQVKELAKFDHLKAEFLKTLTHELRTPITSINLAAQTLTALLEEDASISKGQQSTVTELLEILHQECQRETGLINDLLAFTYLDAEATPMLIDTVDLQTWIPSIVRLFAQRMHSRHQQVYLVVLAGLPSLTTDLSDLERILTELLTNACKYTPTGELIMVSADISTYATRLSVSSTGVEIAPAEQARIFEAFYRIPNSDPWQHGGTGLGLALVQKLVKRLGASIQVKSGAGQTTFTVEFPHLGTADQRVNCSDRQRVIFLPTMMQSSTTVEFGL